MQSYRSDPVTATTAAITTAAVQPARLPQAAPADGAGSVQTIDLEASRVLRFHASAGTLLYVLEGEVRLTEAPRWLAGSVWQWPQRLPAGSMVRLPAGWVELLARHAASLRLQVPAATPWWRRWSGLAGWR